MHERFYWRGVNTGPGTASPLGFLTERLIRAAYHEPMMISSLHFHADFSCKDAEDLRQGDVEGLGIGFGGEQCLHVPCFAGWSGWEGMGEE